MDFLSYLIIYQKKVKIEKEDFENPDSKKTGFSMFLTDKSITKQWN